MSEKKDNLFEKRKEKARETAKVIAFKKVEEAAVLNNKELEKINTELEKINKREKEIDILLAKINEQIEKAEKEKEKTKKKPVKTSKTLILETEKKIGTFSKEFIKEQIENLFKEQGATVGNVDIKIENKEVVVNINDITAKGEQVKSIEIILQDTGNGLSYKNHKITAGFILKNTINILIGSKIKNAPEELKKYIEKINKKRVKKMWIEGALLKVEYV